MWYEVGKVYNWRYLDVGHHVCRAPVRLAELPDPHRGRVRVETMSSPGHFIMVGPTCLEELPVMGGVGLRARWRRLRMGRVKRGPQGRAER
jgi:hypothetical protein